MIDLLGPLSDGKIFQVEAAIFVTIIWLMKWRQKFVWFYWKVLFLALPEQG